MPGIGSWTLAAVLVSGLTGGSLAVPGNATTLGSPTANAAAAAAGPVPETVALTLPTGEAVTALVRDGAVLSVRTPSTNDALIGMTAGGRSLVVPASAQPYVGWWLDPALFDIQPQLERRDSGAARVAAPRPPGAVRVEYAGARVPAVPGLTVRSAAGGVATAAITDPAAFGRALVAQTRRSGGDVGRRPPVAGVRRISPVAQPAGAAPSAAAAQAAGTLDITLLDETGTPSDPLFASVAVINTDDARLFERTVRTSGGHAQLQVPEGHYTLVTAVATWEPGSGRIATMRVAMEQDVEVTSAGAAVTLDIRAATATPGATTPRPATPAGAGFTWLTTDALTEPEEVETYTPRISMYGYAPAGLLRFTPTPPARFGHGVLSLGIGLAGGTPSTPQPYSYHVGHQTQGIPADLTRNVRPEELGTVATTFNGDGRRLTGGLRHTWIDEPFTGETVDVPVTIPSRHTAYVTARYAPGRTPQWISTASYPDAAGSRIGEEYYPADRWWSIAPGGSREQSWGGGPLSRYEVPDPDGFAWLCAGDAWEGQRRLDLNLTAMRDAAGNRGGVPYERTRSTVTRMDPDGDVTLHDGSGVSFSLLTIPEPRTYRVRTEITRLPTGARQSRFIRGEIVFRSGEGVDVPLDEGIPTQSYCDDAITMLNARLRLPVDLNGQLPVGATQLRLTVGHTPYGAPHAITSATVQVKAAGGAWQDVPLGTPSGGTYTARLNNPRAWAGKDVDLRFTATDAAGGRLTQEITAAYSVRG
jgi:hypothetical protein